MIQLKPDLGSALKNMAEALNRSPDDIVNDLIARELETWQDEIDPAVLEDLDRQHAITFAFSTSTLFMPKAPKVPEIFA
ncbi:MAG: hypothetical protein LBP33_04175 [Candidatus Adiutrix sp.]|jgi:predicted transcriptional regulator|nr:hypothetical protein [Candidatus Adiutrix sp.]